MLPPAPRIAKYLDTISRFRGKASAEHHRTRPRNHESQYDMLGHPPFIVAAQEK